jgi:hypothetical protein
MPPSSKPLTVSAGYSKGGVSSARTHLPSGRLDESCSLGSKSKGSQQPSHLRDTSGTSYTRKSQHSPALLQLTGYPSSKEEQSESRKSLQDPRRKLQKLQVKHNPRKREIAKFKSSEFVESDSDSAAGLSKSDSQHPSSIGLQKQTSYTKAIRDPKGTQNGGSSKRSKLVLTMTKQGDKAMKRRVLSPPASRVDAKRPKLLGGFIDNESGSDSDFESDGSEDSGASNNLDEEEHGSDLDITVNWKSKAASPPPRPLPLEIRRPAPNPGPQPPQKPVSFSRLQELIRRKEAKVAERATSPDTSSEQASTAMRTNTSSRPAQATLRGNQSSSSTTSQISKKDAPLAQKSTSDRSALGRPKLQPAKDTARRAMHGDSTPANEMPSCLANLKPGMNTLNAVKAAQSAPRPVRNTSQAAAKPGSVPPPTKKLDMNRLGISSNTAATRHVAQAPRPAVALQSSSGVTGHAGLVEDLIQDIRHSGQPHNAATARTSTSTPAQARKPGSDGQMRNRPQNAKTNPQSQKPHQPQSGSSDSSLKPVKTPSAPAHGTIDALKSGNKLATKQSGPVIPSRQQKTVANQNPVAPTSGVIDTVKSQSKPTTTQSPEQRPASRTHSLNVSMAPVLQKPNSESSTQKRKAEDMTSGPSTHAPLAKRPATMLAKSNTAARPSTEALEPAKSAKASLPSKITASLSSKSDATTLARSITGARPGMEALEPAKSGNRSLSSKMTASPSSNAESVEKRAAASVLTSTTKQKPQISAPTITGQQEEIPPPSATTDQEPKTSRDMPRNGPKEVVPDSAPAVFNPSSAGSNPAQWKEVSTGSQGAVSTPNPSVSANIPAKRSTTAAQAPRDQTVHQGKDTEPKQVSSQSVERVPGPTSNSRSVKPAEIPKVTPSLPEKTIPADQPTNKSANQTTSSPASAISSQKPAIIASRRESTPVVILSTSPTLAPGAEPYFEFSIFQKIWSDSDDESTISATELISRPCTNVDDANTQAEIMFNDTLRQYQEHFQVQVFERTNQLDEHGCNVFKGTFARIEYLHKKSHMKLWVQRDSVSVYAGRGEKDLKNTSFIAKTVYMLRLFKLVPATAGSEIGSTTSAPEYTRVYHPLPCTECYTTADAANRAAKNLQIEMSHKKNPSYLDKHWQVQNLEQLNKRVRDLAEAKEEEGRYWKSEFNGLVLGASSFELLVEKVGLCGPRNL